MIRTLILATTEDQQQPARDGCTPPWNEMRSAHASHGAQCRHQRQQHVSPPRGKPFEPVQTLDRGPPGLRCRHLEGRDLFEVLIKRSRAMADDAHRVEAIRRIGILQQLVVVAAAYEMRDEIRQPRNRDGGEDHTGRPHTQTVRGRPHLLVILSGVSQETDVTDVAAVHRTGVSSTQGP